jgi:hypothetical protein
MSVVGQKQTFRNVRPMSAIPLKADICPLSVVVSSGRRNTLSQTQEMEWTAMGRRYVRGFNAVAKEELWNRWRCAFVAQPSDLATQ